MVYVTMLWYLLLGHLVADYPLQTDFMAYWKNPWAAPFVSRKVPWTYVMAAHCGVHAAAVTLITGQAWLGISEFFCHYGIDVLKCAGKTSIDLDQFLHLVCKVVWVGLLALLVR